MDLNRPCPHCTGRLYLRKGRWLCDDHARCGYATDATPDELQRAIDTMSSRKQYLLDGAPTPHRARRLAILDSNIEQCLAALPKQGVAA